MQLLVRLYYNAVFGGLGGLIGWMLYGAFGWKNPTDVKTYIPNPFKVLNKNWSDYLLSQEDLNFLIVGMLIGGAIAYFVVSVEAIRDRSLARFARLSTYGVVLGAIGGGLGGLLGVFIKNMLMDALGEESIVVTMLSFSIGWTILGLAVGMSEGIAARSLGKFSYGMIGGALGGFIGGLVYGAFIQAYGSSYFWTATGLVIMGACIGSLTALVRAVFLPASVKVLRGWQEGREYGLEKVATLLGRKEHADIPLFRDMKVEKEHAIIRRLGKRYMLFNNNSPPDHTRVNDKSVPQAVELHDGDRIQLGNVILRFQMRAAVNRPRVARRPAAGTAPGAGSAALQEMLKK